MSKVKAPKYALTDAQRHMYASERLMNFRWISRIVAKYSAYTLTDKDLASADIELELADIGQYAEIASNNVVPVSFIFNNLDKMLQPDFPLEGYEGLRESVWVAEYFGRVSHLHSYVAYRPQSKQLIAATSGTCSVPQAMQDLRTLYHRPRLAPGVVHSGFWSLYKGVRDLVYAGIAQGFREHPDAEELVITGHSMGGAVSYLLIIDAFLGKIPIPAKCRLKLVSFGAPRVGDETFVNHWRDLRSAFQEKHEFTELCVKAYNDGVPSLPPLSFGYRHFTEKSLYLIHGRLYNVPPSECEFSLFLADPAPTYDQPIQDPRGGHNYYNGRDMERVLRRLQWLDKAMPGKDDWVKRYKKRASKHRAPSVCNLKPGLPPSSSSMTMAAMQGPKQADLPTASSKSSNASSLAESSTSSITPPPPPQS
ncbi:alpha/beta-hydrolase [Hymenopellis radicata]|nr:alpha/beta-hydrolase [Hymenopellis radicata]